jgi:hypothetical protein
MEDGLECFISSLKRQDIRSNDYPAKKNKSISQDKYRLNESLVSAQKTMDKY